jgi:hypothetical protein
VALFAAGLTTKKKVFFYLFEVVHHVEFVEEGNHDDVDVEYHIEHDEDDDDDETETSEIILCVDTSAAGQEPEFEVIQQPVYIPKPSPAKIINKPQLKTMTKISKPGDKRHGRSC